MQTDALCTLKAGANFELCVCSCLATGDSHTGAIVGGVVGGVLGLALLALLAGLVFWSRMTFSFRARKRLIEDHVYTIVIGAQSSNVFAWSQTAEKDAQVKACSNMHWHLVLLQFIELSQVSMKTLPLINVLQKTPCAWPM